MTEKTQQYNSVESSKLKSKAWTSVLKISVDGRYCLGVIGGFWLSKGQIRGGAQKCNNYKDNSLIVMMSLNMHSPSANPDSVPSADSHAKTMADRILYQKISRGVVPRGANPRAGQPRRGRGSRETVVVTLAGQSPPPEPYILRATAPAVSHMPLLYSRLEGRLEAGMSLDV